MDYKGFILRFFAAVGLIVPSLLGLLVWGLWHNGLMTEQAPSELPKQIVLNLDLTKSLVEQSSGFQLSLPALIEEGNGQPFFSLVIALKKAKNDPRVKSVVARLGPYAPSLVHAQELAAALQDFRQSGKPTSIFAPSYGPFGPGGSVYYLASQFEQVWLQPVGSVALTGLGFEAPFGKSALEKWGITTDYLRREEYKSVMENISRDSFSPPVKKNMQEMIESLATQMADGIAIGRQIKAAKVRDFMANGPYTANEAFKKGLITHLGYHDEMIEKAKEKAGKNAEIVDAGTYLYLFDKENNEKTKADVALIYAEGIITDAPSSGPYRMADGEMIDTQALVGAFEKAAKNEKIKAILFRVNSPGGSPVASETIRRAMILAKKAKKPVFVSMGRVAASGGYWISMDATHIVANPATITGSIGVVAGKLVLGGLFNKLDINWDSFATSENAKMWSTREGFTNKHRTRMNAMLDETYDTFVKNVSTARKISMEKMPDIAKGRIFTGAQALKLGLVDELGGMETTVAAIKKELKLEAKDKISLILLPEPETPKSIMLQILKDFMSSSAMIKNLGSQFLNIKASLKVLCDSLESTNGISARLPSYAFY